MHTQDLVLPYSLARFPNLATWQSVNLIVDFTIKDRQDYSTSLIEFVLYRITLSDCLTSHRAKIGILSMGFRVRSIQPMFVIVITIDVSVDKNR